MADEGMVIKPRDPGNVHIGIILITANFVYITVDVGCGQTGVAMKKDVWMKQSRGLMDNVDRAYRYHLPGR